MTDWERAEDFYEDNECYSYLSEIKDFEEVFDFVKDRIKHAYLGGLSEGRGENKNEWHNLDKNPKDLPTDDRPVIIKVKTDMDSTYYVVAYYIDTLQEFVMDYSTKSIQKEEVVEWKDFL